ncbi:PKD domain-containing protein [bacterium]|nr:MAG: PKD domain-containing protein [bacterium]
MEMKKNHLNIKNRKGAFGVLFSLMIILVAVPFWAGAFIQENPYINLFSANANSGFYVGQAVEFKIKGGDKQDNSINAILNYGDNAIYTFTLVRGNNYQKEHIYNNSGRYYPTLTLKDSAGREKIFKLDFIIEKEWQPKIKEFKFNEESSKILSEKTYIDYEIECKEKSDYKANIDWGDNDIEKVDIFCGPAIISHEYEKVGSYNVKLILKTADNEIIDNKELRIIIENGESENEDHNPNTRFFIRTSWPTENEEIIFVDASTDPDGNGDIQKWVWSFGDRKSSYDRNPKHIYTVPGNYKVSLTVTDKSNREDTYYQWVDVFKKLDYDLVRVRGQQEVYQIIDGKYHWIPAPSIFNNYGFKESDIKPINQSEMNRYERVKLVRVGASPDVYYITTSWMKRKVPNMDVFYSYGNKLEDVISISQTELNWYPENRLIKFDNDWKIYYLENGQKRWIKSADVFNRLGFDWTKIAPVSWQEINAYPTGTAID